MIGFVFPASAKSFIFIILYEKDICVHPGFSEIGQCPEDIAKVSGQDTKLIASADVVAKEKAGEAIMSGLMVELENVRAGGVTAYNPNKQFHPKANNWVGFIIEIGSDLLALVLNITGRVLATILGVGLMVVGIALTMTVAGAPVGIPFAILGFLLMIRSIF